MSKKRANKRAAAQAKNQSANPRRAKNKKARPAPQAGAPAQKAAAPKFAPSRGTTREEIVTDVAPPESRRASPRPSAHAEKKKKHPSPSTRVAIAVLLAAFVMLGFWLLFRRPSS
jgi:cobalamin biosynthesis Mg chelatase CobN